VAEAVSGVTEYAGALSIVAKDAGVVHADRFGPTGAKLARLTLPSGTIGGLIDDPRRAPTWQWKHRPDIAKSFLRLVRRASVGVSAFDTDDPDLLDILALLTARPVSSPRGSPPGWLEQTMADLRQSWHPGLTVRDVARVAGVHPVYLARSVRRWYGTGVGEELRNLRFRRAVAAIAGSKATVSNVAHETGFSDEAHLCRSFQQSLGISPRRYRTLLRGSSR
ncbi:MAG TPA: AraC family transcriptional regulator, partial [Gemmatimonadaceae bacterium]|nr:AraC family transcriptional regulator [Gemmatimonadaceae bacterium]